MAVAAAAGRAHRDENGAGALDAARQVGLERQAPGLHIGGDHFVQARLEDRDAALAQGFDLGGILVDADDLVTEFGQTGTRNEPHIARADHRNAHGIPKVSGLPLTDLKMLKIQEPYRAAGRFVGSIAEFGRQAAALLRGHGDSYPALNGMASVFTCFRNRMFKGVFMVLGQTGGN
jgi:hypothetical protein